MSEGERVGPVAEGSVYVNTLTEEEAGQVLRALDMLALALVGHTHDWQPAEIDAYQRAARLMERQWVGL